MNLFLQTIRNLRPNSAWKVVGDDNYENLEWLDTEQTKPTEDEFNAELQRLQELELSNAYKNKRAAEYPSIGDQLDALFHAGVFPEEMAAQIQAVKDKYPKA